MLINELNEILSDSIIEYTMQMFSDTRLLLDIKTQSRDEPIGLDDAIFFMISNKDLLVRAIQLYNINSQAVASEINKASDPIRRIALWGAYIKEYGRSN